VLGTSEGEPLMERLVIERVIGERIVREPEETLYRSLAAFCAGAEARFRDGCRVVDASYFHEDGEIPSAERFIDEKSAAISLVDAIRCLAQLS
jgi:hypothetical protein